VSQTLTGITHQCDAFNYALLIKELARFGEANIVPVIESLMTRHVEGIIFAGPEWNENVKLAQSQLPPFCPPLIFLKCQPTPQFTTISIDNYGGARAAVDHLLSLGRHKIGLITGPLEWLEARQRKQGWEDGLKNVGIEVTPQHWSEGNWSSASGEAAFAELLEKYHGMNAVFASNDQMALGAFHLAHQRGLRIPEDLAFIGFDNLAEGAYFTPPLTTIEQPLEELGQLAVTTLLAQIEESDAKFPENSTILKTKLVVRASTPSA
jgi:LacI family transcriptional regulator